MLFQNPWGALVLLSAIPLVILYLLKQRREEVVVPSTALWERALSEWEASHPWQKWRNSLLFFLQLITLILLALALMRPVWRISGMGKSNAAVIDLSVSMRAVENGVSRIERAKLGVAALIEAMRAGEEMTLVVAGEQSEALAVRSGDKEALLRILEPLEAQYGKSRLDEAAGLAAALLEGAEMDEGGRVVYVFTDHAAEAREDPSVSTIVRNVATGAENVAITGVTYGLDSQGGLTVLGLLHNYGGAKAVSVELWGDGALLDVRGCELPGDGSANVLLDDLSPALRRVTLAISEDDALLADNTAYAVIQDSSRYRVLLMTERNVFLEKAILLRDDIDLYKTTPSEVLPGGEFSLVIGDGWPHGSLPGGQDIWIISPQAGTDWFGLFEAGAQANIQPAGSGRYEPILSHVDLAGLKLARASGFELKDPATAVLAYIGEAPLIIRAENAGGNGTKRLAFGFDLHDSSLPLQKDFPILVQNILNWFLPPADAQTGRVTAGSPAFVTMAGDTASYDVLTPGGKNLTGLTRRQFDGTGEPGFYSVIQRDGAGGPLAESAFAINPVVEDESELRTAGGGTGSAENGGAELRRSLNLWPYVILSALLLMAAEWWVYHRGA